MPALLNYRTLRAKWQSSAPVWVRSAINRSSLLRAVKDATIRHIWTIDDIYDAQYCEYIDHEAQRSASAIVASVVRDLEPRTLLDVGCGTGAMLQEFARRGVDVVGLDCATNALRYCRERGLTVHEFDLTSTDVPPVGRFDVAMSMEVAEHLPADAADRLVELVTRAGNTVVFTAAPPGQEGRHHVNVQPPHYWIQKFSARGFTHDLDRSLEWRSEWQRKETADFYAANVMVFTSDGRRP